MSLRGLLSLAVRDLAAARARALISAAGIGLGVAVLAIVTALGLGARDLVLKEVVRELPVDTIEVIPKTMDLGLFKVNTGALFGAKPLDAPTVQALGQIPGVSAAYPKLEVSVPMGAQGGARLFGRRLYTDLFMTGLPPELIQAEVGESFVDTPGIVPVVISDQLIEVYNTSVAPALKSPQLTATTLTGFEFEIVIGQSIMLGSRGARTVGTERARILGASRYAMRLGVTVPIDTARRLLATYGEPSVPERYASVLLRAESPSSVPVIAQAVESMGFAVDETASKTRNILTTATALASGVGVLVLLLAALNIAHSFLAALSERRRELAILRAVGARRLDLVSLVLTQAALLGVLGGAAGVLFARLGGWAIDWAATALMPDFPFKPESFFVFAPWLYGVGLLAAVLAAALGALWPALRAARAPVARALAEA